MIKPINLNTYNKSGVHADYYGFLPLTERSGELEFGCTLLFLDIPGWKRELTDAIQGEDLYKPDTHGLELDPHVTIFCGLRDQVIDADDVKGALVENNVDGRQMARSIHIREVSYFDNPEFDVLKLDVESGVLRTANAKLKELPSDQLWASYMPHITIAYLENGKAEKYIKKFTDMGFSSGLDIRGGEIIYSDRKFKKTTIEIDV